MEAIGKLIAILPEQSGQTERGAWKRGGFVIETDKFMIIMWRYLYNKVENTQQTNLFVLQMHNLEAHYSKQRRQ